MLWITLLLALLIALAALAFAVWPMVSREIPLRPVEDDRLTELLARKDSALRALKDLEFDHQVGKIGDEDHDRFYTRLSRQAMGLIQQLEQITPQTAELEDALEKEIGQWRRVQASTHRPVTGSNSEATVAAANDDDLRVTTPHVRFCTQCGKRVDPSFNFCANCGSPIASAAAVTGRA